VRVGCGHGHATVGMCEGPAKKSTDPPVQLLIPDPPTHHPTFFLTFFSTFLGVSRQGEFKNTIKIFLQKVHVENISQKNQQNSDVSFSSTFFCFIAFSGVSQRWEFKNTSKKRFSFCKKRRVKSFYKKFDQKSKADVFQVFLDFFLLRFWAFLGEGSSKTR
jgi:hypothetical protein